MKKFCTLYLVRHGETDWNARKLIQGHKDIPLNEKGRVQAKKLADELKGIDFDKIYSSDLKRASQTAEIIAQERNLKVITSSNLRERDFGIFVGRTFVGEKNLIKLIKTLQKSTKEDSRIENDKNLLKRFAGYIKKISKNNLGKIILVATHAGTIRALLVSLGWGTYESLIDGCIDNLAYVKLLSDGKKFTIKETFGVAKIG
ncbi:MAG: hypothetical protein US40_C0004G0056 [Candidatus Roizmanbacteria bacterium GW2011_GWC2_37_13]|uniref:Phosphoglycerate mutase n=1 Tax=Candidatus Roizmanbacteria bacterium GW2011_GWC2_37_13 TaxID=1618486 RepID=A0A0G0JCX0_9BACT|nr:MAG: alpha-ribazole phosphatase, phosphoglycerate mutase [Candidatus Roizmanbacteria bacterium GW2011_GWC1_37_12]KKQ26021.1 MAG: hypothetical protein US40_C0004G0056 [Candidatus Roizmanbacteria bacterium GW2011_GWC2_37_13]